MAVEPGMLKGRTALVTGAGRGIGRAVARALAAVGVDVAVNYRSDAESAAQTLAAVEAEGVRGFVLRADVSQADEVAAMMEVVRERWGRLDILVNNAGILTRTSFLDISEAEWDAVLSVNLKGVFLCSREAARIMKDAGGGCIVNVSSTAGLKPSPRLAHYAVSKAGVTMLTRQTALELAPLGIRVNEVNPGLIVTDMNRHDLTDRDFREGRLVRMPLGRFGDPGDVAGAVVFLASPAASLITGASLAVDAGFLVS